MTSYITALLALFAIVYEYLAYDGIFAHHTDYVPDSVLIALVFIPLGQRLLSRSEVAFFTLQNKLLDLTKRHIKAGLTDEALRDIDNAKLNNERLRGLFF